ncbi:hypothetical protein L1987_42940 [Smallanthus sonchifolius]|uniref:Uncharacterized protein n=1 Tax=Smallanthus sonchifolius TaxID=185202 RepID=A0ACB9GM95_9ASTR|nr:hypothetical protein L1987_42940 [Smallanthus sonchifolius]
MFSIISCSNLFTYNCTNTPTFCLLLWDCINSDRRDSVCVRFLLQTLRLFISVADLLMASVQKTLVFDDVAKHNKIDDCWIIISGKVYDVTPFMDDHPGGGEVMRKATGKDATVDYGDVGHSTAANEMMQKYYVGEFDQSTIPEKRSYMSSTTEKIYNLKKSPQFMIKVLLVGIMAAALRILVVSF